MKKVFMMVVLSLIFLVIWSCGPSVGNNPPNIPSNPSPPDGAVDVPIDVTLS